MWIKRCHIGQPTVAHFIQCGGGRGGPPLGILGGGTGGGGEGGAAMTTKTWRRWRGGKYRKETMADGGQRRGIQG